VHEYSIALDMWESVAAAAQKHGAGRVRSITLEIGALNLIEEEQLSFWIGALAEREGSPEVKLKITVIPANLRCRACGWEGEVAVPEGASFYLPAALLCAACGSRDVVVLGGRELRVVSAEVETEPKMEIRDRLAHLVPHWIEHNESHAAQLREWAERAGEAGLERAAESILAAESALQQANKALEGAQEALEEGQ